MKFKIFKLIHIALIIITCVFSTYYTYYEFINKPLNNKILNFISKPMSNDIIKIYSRWTGIESGYGFFGPNVRSSGFIEVEACDNKIYPKLKSFESNNRFSSLSSAISDHLLIQKTDSLKKNKKEYFDLIYKNILVKTLSQSNCISLNSKINYTILDYPTLKRIRKDKEIKLIKFQEINYETIK